MEFNELAGTSNDRGVYGHRLYGVLHPPITGACTLALKAVLLQFLTFSQESTPSSLR